MIFTINAIHGGYMAGMIAFGLFWYSSLDIRFKFHGS